MTAKTRRLRELIASGKFLYMPSAATPIEGRLAEAMGTPLVYTGGYVSGASRAITEPLLTMDEPVRIAAEAAPRLARVPLGGVQSRGNRDGRPILPLGELEGMGYRGCIDAQLLLGAALQAMKKALGEIMATGSYAGLSDAEFTALRKEIED